MRRFSSSLGHIWRASGTLLRVGLAQGLAYRTEIIVWILTSTLPLIMLALWTTVAKDGPVGSFAARDFVVYYLATLFVRQLTGSWVVWELNMEIRQGLLSVRLLKPISPLVCYAADSLAMVPLRALFAGAVAMILFLTVGGAGLTRDPRMLCLGCVAMAGAWLLQFLVMAIIGTLALFIESSLGIFQIQHVLFTLLSGYAIPLGLYPRWLEHLSRLLPFRYMQGYPVELLMGRLSLSRGLQELAIQMTFAIALLGLLAFLWRAGLKRYQAYGG